MNFSPRRALAIARKEMFHILRDPFTLALALGLPVMMVLVYGEAIEFNLKGISLAVSDQDGTQASRRLVDAFAASGYFKPRPLDAPSRAVDDVGAELTRAALVIPPRFEKDLLAGRSAGAQILLDGADNSTVGPALGYVESIRTLASKRLAGFEPRMPYELRTRFLFNPELNSRWFVIPGLTVVVMAILSIFLTALTVAREWENGSMELLLSTPVQPLEIIAGKLAPYAGLGALALSFVYVMARLLFGVPFVGSLWVFGLGCALFLATYLAQGLLISVAAKQQTIAMQLAMMTGLLPSNLLSGFVFPIASMPLFFRGFTMILPARWFMVISRRSFLQGSSLFQLAGPFAFLAVSCALMITAATRRFKRSLE